MRKKLKELLHKEEGFTLVELLAVIVILGIIVAISIPAVGGVIDNSRTKANEAEKELVIDAARLYFTTETDADDTVTVTELENTGYLEVRSTVATDDNYNTRATVTRKSSNASEGENATYTYSYAVGED